jgi:hypothetical protein
MYFGPAVADRPTMSRPLLLLVLSGLLALMTWSVREPDADARSEREALRLQEALDQRAVRTEQQTQTLAQELADLGPTKWMQRYAATLELERERSGTLFLGFLNDSLVCWTGHPPASMTAILDDTAAAQRTLPDGIYQYVHASEGPFRLHALTPVWLTPTIENRYLQRSFHRALDTPAELSAQPVQATGPLITDAAGAPLLRLAWRGDALDAGPWIILRLVLLLLSAGALIAACWLFIPTLVADRSPWLSITLFLTFLLALRWSVLSFIPSAPFDRLPLFDPATYAASFAFPSLGDLVINAALIAMAVLYIRRALGRHAPIAPGISLDTLAVDRTPGQRSLGHRHHHRLGQRQ